MELTPTQFWGTFLMNEYKKFREFERQQMSVASGIAMTFGKGKPITYESVMGDSQRPKEKAVQTEDGRIVYVRERLENFPDDVTYLTEESIKTVLYLSKIGKKAKPWDTERAKAHLGEYGIEAKRCSASDELWAKFKTYQASGVPVKLSLVKAWAEMEWITDLLSPQSWDIERAKCTNKTPEEIRSAKLGQAFIDTLLNRYQELLKIK